jgi:hypothetical protein
MGKEFRSIKHHALVGTQGPSGRGADAGVKGLIAAVSAACQSMEGKGGGCCCDIDIVRDLQTVERVLSKRKRGERRGGRKRVVGGRSCIGKMFLVQLREGKERTYGQREVDPIENGRC